MFITDLYGTTRHTNLQVKESRCSEAQTHKLDLCQKCIQPSLLISGIIHFEEDNAWNMTKQNQQQKLYYFHFAPAHLKSIKRLYLAEKKWRFASIVPTSVYQSQWRRGALFYNLP